jgi:hypothetical protein
VEGSKKKVISEEVIEMVDDVRETGAKDPPKKVLRISDAPQCETVRYLTKQERGNREQETRACGVSSPEVIK